VREKEQRKSIFTKKNSPRMLLLAEFVVCDRRTARQAQRAVKLASWLQHNHAKKHKSGDLLLLICMSFDEQYAPNKTRSLCA
jgi:hypothetical protein